MKPATRHSSFVMRHSRAGLSLLEVLFAIFVAAVGLLGLCWILFGRGFLGRPGSGTHWRHRMSERWEQMTPEQHATFRKGLHSCGQFEPPPAEPKA